MHGGLCNKIPGRCAVALKNVEAETVAEALVTMFTRVGVPQEVLRDQGTQFMTVVGKSTCHNSLPSDEQRISREIQRYSKDNAGENVR